jgi:hypothetical protein
MSFGLKISFGRLCRREELDFRLRGLGYRSFSDEMKRMDAQAKDSVGWSCVQSGWTIYKKPEGLSLMQMIDEREWPRDEKGKPIYHKPLGAYDIREGMEVIVKNTPADYRWNLMTVSRDSYGQYQLMNEYIGVSMGLSNDDREDCWVSYGIWNMRAISKSAVTIGVCA